MSRRSLPEGDGTILDNTVVVDRGVLQGELA